MKGRARLLGRNLQIGKVALGARSDPQCDSSVPRIELEIIDDQAGLLRAVYVEPRFAAFHLDFTWSRHRAANRRTTRTFREPPAVTGRNQNPDTNCIEWSDSA